MWYFLGVLGIVLITLGVRAFIADQREWAQDEAERRRL